MASHSLIEDFPPVGKPLSLTEVQSQVMAEPLVSLHQLNDFTKRPKKFLLLQLVDAKVPIYKAIKGGDFYITEQVAKNLFGFR